MMMAFTVKQEAKEITNLNLPEQKLGRLLIITLIISQKNQLRLITQLSRMLFLRMWILILVKITIHLTPQKLLKIMKVGDLLGVAIAMKFL